MKFASRKRGQRVAVGRRHDRELMLDPNQVVYKCTECNTVFHHLPTEDCLFCGVKFDVEPKRLKSDPNEMDYKLW